MLLLGCFGPWMNGGIIIYFCFKHNQRSRLYIHRVTYQVLLPLLYSLKGFILVALKPNHTFYVSSTNSRNVMSTFCHFKPSMGCLNIASTLRYSLCNFIILACSLVQNKCFKHGIVGNYHMTLVYICFVGGFALNITRAITPYLISWCITHWTNF